MASNDNTFQTTFGTASVSGNLAMGQYENDPEFIIDAPKFAKSSAIRLGHPVLQVELYDPQFYSLYEESVLEYSHLVNTANTKYWLINLYGTATGSNINQTYPLNNTNLYERFLEPFKKDSGISVRQTLHTASITLQYGQQIYDIRNALPQAHISSGIEVQEIHHYAPSAIGRALSDWYGGADNVQFANSLEYGSDFGMLGDIAIYSMYPLTFTVQRAQAVELSDRIRRSEFSYDLRDNNLRIFPLPGSQQHGLKVFFTYYTINSSSTVRDSVWQDNSSSGVVDISNIPYSYISYSFVNDIGKQWIRNYAFALVKETLGNIRGKFTSLPIPGAETTLNWSELINSAQTEKQMLREQLMNDLLQLDPNELIKKRAESMAAIEQSYNAYPLGIYLG